MIGPRNGELFHVVEQSYALPRFSMYAPLPAASEVRNPPPRPPPEVHAHTRRR
jgi:hypothetical protein